MYTIQRIDNLGRGTTFDVNASSGVYVRAFAGTLAASLAQSAPAQRQSVTLLNPSTSTAMNVVLTPTGEGTASNVGDSTKYPVFCQVPAGGFVSVQIGSGIRVWCRSATTTAITGASALEGV
jgi:hypothetical protein